MPLPPLPDPDDQLTRLRNLAKAVPVTGWLFGTLLGANSLQTASLLTLPFSRGLFRKINRELADGWWGHCVSVAQRPNSAELSLYGDEVPVEENAIVVVNHQQMPDITWLMDLAKQKGRLGDMKWFVKDEIKWVPGVGWGMVFLDCLFVKRDWAEDERSIAATFERILQDDVPLWLVLFPEGTRITPEKLESSDAFAERAGIEPTEHVLLPRTNGFVASVQGLRGHVKAVYDLTLGYEAGVPTLWQFIKGVNRRAHLHVRRVPIDELPEEPEALGSWLQQAFIAKDRRLARFYETGSFED
jgi:1-acyl-sn-glycerol-3-phosphate acyltransferase